MSSASTKSLNVVVWGENRHEQIEPHVAEIYPDGGASVKLVNDTNHLL